MSEYTPMMKEYLKTKEEYPDCILFYRLGDFYEMFFEDAKVVSKELELTLTGKSCGKEERAPMCGVPFHAVDNYLSRLVEKGYKVAICEQLEDPKQAKGLVKRGVTRIVTPGTNIDTSSLEEGKNNYICCIYDNGSGGYGLSFADVSTGENRMTEVDGFQKLKDEVGKYTPSEIVGNEAFSLAHGSFLDEQKAKGVFCSNLDTSYFVEANVQKVLKDHFHVMSLEALGLMDYKDGTLAAGALLSYLLDTQKNGLSHMTTIRPYITGNYCLIDSSSFRNLELVETMREKEKRGSLIWVLDKTKTAMGARMLRSMMERPLINIDRINARLDAVEELSNHMMDREELREYLTLVYDLERLLMRISYGSANPRDLLAFRTSLSALPAIRTLLLSFSSSLMQELAKELDPMEDLYQLLMDELDDDPPVSVHDGDIIRLGFSEEVDMLRKAKTEGKSWLAGLEERERERTGIKTLKVKYNKVFGYYLEVSNSYKDMVPEDYIRKQTLANAERFYTPELKELENTILGSEDKLNHLENVMFTELVRLLSDNVSRIQKTAKAIAACDVLCSLSYVAQKQGYVRPVMNTEGRIHIEEGRHPVVEMMIPSGSFVSNDTVLDDLDNRIAIITGPNMAGKSTYMRQTALIVLMAQIGSFVPAGRAEIGIVDRIFTRVGASDDLASGQSTFMVEMNEVANILKNATSKSLIILDEIGRGTSTFDGLSIAWAVVEHIADASILGAKTLFATHYHELTELEGRLAGVHNYCIAVKENGDDIVFLRKIITGGADRSYGIEVARLAGVPQSVIDRSKEIAERLSDDDIRNRMRDFSGDTEEKPVKAKPKKKEKKNDQIEGQMSLFDSFGTIDTQKEELLQSIADLDLNHMSPMDAMNRLYELQGKVRELE